MPVDLTQVLQRLINNKIRLSAVIALVLGLVLVLVTENHNHGITVDCFKATVPESRNESGSKTDAKLHDDRALAAFKCSLEGSTLLWKVVEHLASALILFGLWHCISEAAVRREHDRHQQLLVGAALTPIVETVQATIDRSSEATIAAMKEKTGDGVMPPFFDDMKKVGVSRAYYTISFPHVHTKLMAAQDVWILAGHGGTLVCDRLKDCLPERFRTKRGSTTIVLIDPNSPATKVLSHKKGESAHIDRSVTTTVNWLKSLECRKEHARRILGHDFIPHYDVIVADDWAIRIDHFLSHTGVDSLCLELALEDSSSFAYLKRIMDDINLVMSDAATRDL